MFSSDDEGPYKATPKRKTKVKKKQPAAVVVPAWCKKGKKITYLGKRSRTGEPATIVSVDSLMPGDVTVRHLLLIIILLTNHTNAR